MLTVEHGCNFGERYMLMSRGHLRLTLGGGGGRGGKGG